MVMWNPDNSRLYYFSNDHDELLKGSIIQRSTDAGNGITLGTDKGLFVPSLGNTESGVVSSPSGTGSSFTQAITFAQTYTSIPALSLCAEYASGILPILRYEALSETGFILHVDEVTGASLGIGNYIWKTN